MSASPCKLVVLVSGNGSNLQAIIDQIEKGILRATITCVVSDKNDAHGLVRAQQHGIPATTVTAQPGEPREEYDNRLQTAIDAHQADWILLAGFMRILSDQFVIRNLGRLINIHPSLLPKYKGLNTHQRVLDAGDPVHGASVHYVTPELDDGPVIMQSTLQIDPHESADALKQKIHELEHQLYPDVVQLLCDQRLELSGQQVLFDGQALQHPLTPAGTQ